MDFTFEGLHGAELVALGADGAELVAFGADGADGVEFVAFGADGVELVAFGAGRGLGFCMRGVRLIDAEAARGSKGFDPLLSRPKIPRRRPSLMLTPRLLAPLAPGIP